MAAYIDYKYFKKLYPDIPKADFDRLVWEACRKMDAATTCVDGVRKLREAFPANEDDAEAVKRCACALVDIMYQLQKKQEAAEKASGYVETANGLRGKVISSVSSGNESISYAAGSSGSSAGLIDKAAADRDAQEQLFRDTITEYLSGIPDANRVNLLFRGPYPYRLRPCC